MTDRMRFPVEKDPALETAFGAAKATLRRLVRGRLVLVIEKVDGRVADYRQEVDALTTADYERLMRERPRGEASGAGRH